MPLHSNRGLVNGTEVPEGMDEPESLGRGIAHLNGVPLCQDCVPARKGFQQLAWYTAD